ncbi:MAG: hypothetical protein H6760_04485 [Candidatus Nomurabacteria bacterium]|nr:MAG: hypothetical protein H6760_04485 [Candidatus Nomurabacteria bacterium]
MAKIQGADLQKALGRSILSQGGGRLPKETLQKALQHPELESALRKQGIARPRAILRAVASGKGAISAERGEKFVKALKQTFGPRRTLKLDKTGQSLRLSASAAREYPKAFIEKASSTTAPTEKKAEESWLDRLARRKKYITRVKNNLGPTQRIDEKIGKSTLDQLDEKREEAMLGRRKILVDFDKDTSKTETPKTVAPSVPQQDTRMHFGDSGRLGTTEAPSTDPEDGEEDAPDPLHRDSLVSPVSSGDEESLPDLPID